VSNSISANIQRSALGEASLHPPRSLRQDREGSLRTSPDSNSAQIHTSLRQVTDRSSPLEIQLSDLLATGIYNEDDAIIVTLKAEISRQRQMNSRQTGQPVKQPTLQSSQVRRPEDVVEDPLPRPQPLPTAIPSSPAAPFRLDASTSSQGLGGYYESRSRSPFAGVAGSRNPQSFLSVSSDSNSVTGYDELMLLDESSASANPRQGIWESKRD
jgi:hypothetical protein